MTQAVNITVACKVNAPVEKVWDSFINPAHITRWNQASDDWHSPRAENNVIPGGTFTIRMEAKDGSFGFDFAGVYEEVETNRLITYKMEDGRYVKVIFTTDGNTTEVTETFEAETQNPVDMQQAGWQAILNSFKNYTETL